MSDKIEKAPVQWHAELTPEQFHVCLAHGTERPFTGKYHAHHEDGVYRCSCCGANLFDAGHKFDSGTGWPSFWQPMAKGAVASSEDLSHGMRRTEVHCQHCCAHLGHIFPDGPLPSGMRYCINSLSLDFAPKARATARVPGGLA